MLGSSASNDNLRRKQAPPLRKLGGGSLRSSLRMKTNIVDARPFSMHQPPQSTSQTKVFDAPATAQGFRCTGHPQPRFSMLQPPSQGFRCTGHPATKISDAPENPPARFSIPQPPPTKMFVAPTTQPTGHPATKIFDAPATQPRCSMLQLPPTKIFDAPATPQPRFSMLPKVPAIWVWKFSRKHGEGFFRWVNLSCSHESHYKVSLQGIIIMKVNARSHCKESLQGVIARSHCKESLQGVIARSHCKESLQGVIARSHCKESLQGVVARSRCKES